MNHITIAAQIRPTLLADGQLHHTIVVKVFPTQDKGEVCRLMLDPDPLKHTCFVVVDAQSETPCAIAYDRHGNMLRHDHHNTTDPEFPQKTSELLNIMAAGWGLPLDFTLAVSEAIGHALDAILALTGDTTPPDPEAFDTKAVDTFLADVSKTCH